MTDTKKKLFSSPVVHEGGRRPNSVAIKASLFLPLVQARAKDRKNPLHENRRSLNRRHVLRYIVPERKLQPVVMTKSPQVVPSIHIRPRDVVVDFFYLEVVDDVVSVYEWKYLFSRISISEMPPLASKKTRKFVRPIRRISRWRTSRRRARLGERGHVLLVVVVLPSSLHHFLRRPRPPPRRSSRMY